MVLWISMMNLALATTDDCDSGDAPAAYETETCQSVCAQVGSEWKCELANLCTDTSGGVWAVSQYGSSSHDAVAFGYCGATEFCCTFDEDSTDVDTVSAYGNNYSEDPLSFTWDLGGLDEHNLEPWDDDEIEAYAYGQGGADEINGSDYDGTDYQEFLRGGPGGDTITGNDDGDYLEGGAGDDTLYGNGGNDRMHGNCGDDELRGGLGNDTLCDHSGKDTCAVDGCNTPDTSIMVGGPGDDTSWYDYGAVCPDGTMDASTSDMNGGTNTCGDDNDWDPNTEQPDNCNSWITTEPAFCGSP